MFRLLAAAITLCLGLTACAQAPIALPAPSQEATETPDVVETPEPTLQPTTEAPEPSDSPEPEPTPSRQPSHEPTEHSPEPTEEPSQEEPSQVPDPTASPTQSEAPKPSAVIAVGDKGDKVRELQHRLLQLQWFEGEITPNYGDQTRLAVEGFQAKRGLPVLGYVDQATWDRLVDMTKRPTRDEMYNVQVAGPKLLGQGDKGDAVKDLQARLKQIGWFSGDVTGNYGPVTAESVRGFQAKREIPVTGEVDQRTKDRLAAMTRKPTTDELNNVRPAKSPSKGMTLDDRCLSGRVICVSKSQRKLAWVIDGRVQMTMDVRFGSELTPTRNGVFSVSWKSRHHVSSIYDTPMPWAMFFSGGQAIHYSADFAARGWNGASYGCVNVRDKGAIAKLYDTVRVGEKVVVY